MRYIVLALTLACLPAFVGAPRPKVAKLGASFVIAPDSTVNATATVSMTGTLQAGDSIRYKFLKDGVVIVNKSSVATTMQANMPAPAYGASSSYTVTANVTRAGSNVGPVVTSPAWVYTRPAAPVPTIDSVRITPASATVAPGATVQFTATAYQS